MARTLSPANIITLALSGFLGVAFVVAPAVANDRAVQAKKPATIRVVPPSAPVAAARAAAPSSVPARVSAPQAAKIGIRSSAAYRNPFSKNANSDPLNAMPLTGPQSRWRLPDTQPEEPIAAESAPLMIAPAQPSRYAADPQHSTLQLLQPPAVDGQAQSTVTAPLPAEITGPQLLAPHKTVQPGDPDDVTQPTAPGPIAFESQGDANAVRSAILTAAGDNSASSNRGSEPDAESSVLDPPDPANFSEQRKQPIWLDNEVTPKDGTAVETVAFDERQNGLQAAQPPSELAGAPEATGDDEPVFVSDFADSPEGWLAEAKAAAQSASTAEELSAVIDLCGRVASDSPAMPAAASARRLASWSHNKRGELLTDGGEAQPALDEFQVAINLDPTNVSAIHNRAVTLAQQNDFEAALEDFNRVIELDPKLAVAYRNRAELLAAQGKAKEAVADYTVAIESAPNDAELRAARAHAYQRLGEFELAMADIDEAIKLSPSAAQGLTQRANLHAERGDYDRALEDFKRSVEINPDVAETYRGIAWLKSTCPIDRNRDAFEALGAAQTACKLSPPDDYLALDVLAAAHANAGEFDKAIDAEQRAIDSAPETEQESMQARLQLYQRRQPFRAPRTR